MNADLDQVKSASILIHVLFFYIIDSTQYISTSLKDSTYEIYCTLKTKTKLIVNGKLWIFA